VLNRHRLGVNRRKSTVPNTIFVVFYWGCRGAKTVCTVLKKKQKQNFPYILFTSINHYGYM